MTSRENSHPHYPKRRGGGRGIWKGNDSLFPVPTLHLVVIERGSPTVREGSKDVVMSLEKGQKGVNRGTRELPKILSPKGEQRPQRYQKRIR